MKKSMRLDSYWTLVMVRLVIEVLLYISWRSAAYNLTSNDDDGRHLPISSIHCIYVSPCISWSPFVFSNTQYL